jgi:hypothetical protein
VYLILVVAFSTALILAQSFGLGQQSELVLYRYIGVPRGLALQFDGVAFRPQHRRHSP